MHHRITVAVLFVVLAGCGGGGGNPGGRSAHISTTPLVSASPSAVTLQRQFIEVVKAVAPTVVQIQTPAGLGSGVVLDHDGDVITNAHVVGRFHTFAITLPDGSQHRGELVGTYPGGDIAVVRLTDARPKPASFGDSSKIAVGEFAFAIGNPLGLRSSVTQGIVSSVGRTISEANGVIITSAVQTSAPINPGNSGGALVDITGRVIGIPTLAATDPEFGGAQAPGIGFAVPSNTARNVAAKLIGSGHVSQAERAFLGVEVSTIVGGGVLVESVQRGGPAADAGIRAGDVIVAVGGTPTPTTEQLALTLTKFKPGQRVKVDLVRRNGQRATLIVKLGAA
ncbi:MAG TPA: trypsin-like peptidase domain-containing protein [Thermoleophilaceae bacterium]|nr:trypsin-like peptidase domain-containing protein [Thermoleophilaceae bacterium]